MGQTYIQQNSVFLGLILERQRLNGKSLHVYSIVNVVNGLAYRSIVAGSNSAINVKQK